MAVLHWFYCKCFNTCHQDFANQAESIFRGSERHTDLDKAYSRLVRTIFDNINRISEDHPKTPREVIMMGRLNMVLDMRKLVFRDCEQQRCRPAYAYAQSDYLLSRKP